jgi:hypothetical protein
MYISRLYFHSSPGKTLALQQTLEQLIGHGGKGALMATRKAHARGQESAACGSSKAV